MRKLSSVLLVDDDQTTNYLSELLFKRLSVADKVFVAFNGQEALDMLREHCEHATEECPALILLDVKMPVMDGFQFLEAYARLPYAEHKAIIIVILTTSLHPHDVERVRRFNVAGFLNKPLTQEKLDDILQTHFQRHLPAG